MGVRLLRTQRQRHGPGDVAELGGAGSPGDLEPNTPPRRGVAHRAAVRLHEPLRIASPRPGVPPASADVRTSRTRSAAARRSPGPVSRPRTTRHPCLAPDATHRVARRVPSRSPTGWSGPPGRVRGRLRSSPAWSGAASLGRRHGPPRSPRTRSRHPVRSSRVHRPRCSASTWPLHRGVRRSSRSRAIGPVSTGPSAPRRVQPVQHASTDPGSPAAASELVRHRPTAHAAVPRSSGCAVIWSNAVAAHPAGAQAPGRRVSPNPRPDAIGRVHQGTIDRPLRRSQRAGDSPTRTTAETTSVTRGRGSPAIRPTRRAPRRADDQLERDRDAGGTAARARVEPPSPPTGVPRPREPFRHRRTGNDTVHRQDEARPAGLERSATQVLVCARSRGQTSRRRRRVLS